jgi:putative lipoic acid-binding regulatory protein
MDNGVCKPRIDYPCPWVYKVIGRDLEGLGRAITEILGKSRHTVTPSRRSKGGAYHCLDVALTVESEAVRIGYYERLRQHPDVMMVL